jgi:hypothetical protein
MNLIPNPRLWRLSPHLDRDVIDGAQVSKARDLGHPALNP